MQDEDPGAGAPTKADQPDDRPDAPDRRPIHALGGAGCLTMILAAAAAIALLSTGSFFAGVAGILIFAVAIGLGMWLINAAGAGKR